MSEVGQTHDPPTATTFDKASQSRAFFSSIPPVGQKRACGKGPARAFRAGMPPAATAGKNLTVWKP